MRLEIPEQAAQPAAHRHREVYEVIGRWSLRLGALTVPLSEAGAEVALLLTAAAAMAKRLTRPQSDSQQSWASRWRACDPLLRAFFIAAVLYFGFGLAGSALSGVGVHGSQLKKILYAVAVAVGLLALPQTDQREGRVVLLWLGAGFGLAFIAGLSQYFYGAFPGESLLHRPSRLWPGQLYVPGTAEKAATGTLRNRIKMSEMLAFAVASALAAWRNRRRPAMGAVAGLFSAMLVLHLSLTHAKLALWSVVAATCAWLVLLGVRPLRRWLGVLLLVSFVGGLAVVIGLGLAEPSGVAPVDAWGARRWAWHKALQLFFQHPVLGSGIGTYREAVMPLFSNPDDSLAINAHNQFLTPLAEGGVVGFIFWFALIVVVGVALARAWRLEGLASDVRARRDLATIFLFSCFLLSWFHDILYHPVMSLLVWTAVGLLFVDPLSVRAGGAKPPPQRV